MDLTLDVIDVNGEKYVKASSVEGINRNKLDSKDYVIVRTYSAGVHVGYLSSRNGKEVTLKQARRIWYWDGAASLSQLSVDGTSKPDSCKSPCAVEEITLTEAIEVIPCTLKAIKSIQAVKEWKK